MKLFTKFIIAAVVVMPSLLFADPPSQEKVMQRLEGYEWTLEPKDFQSLGDEVVITLMNIVETKEPLLNYYRFRALEALRLFPTEQVGAFLEKHSLESADYSKARRAFHSLATAFGDKQPNRVEKVAAKLMQHKNPHIRKEVAKQLWRIGTPSAKAILERQQTQEKSDFVRRSLFRQKQ